MVPGVRLITLRINDVYFAYPTKRSGWFSRTKEGQAPVDTLKGVSLEVERGNLFGLIGPNGSGKTTIAKLILGVIEPGLGTIEVDGQRRPSLRLNAWRQRLGFVSGAMSRLFNSLDLNEHFAFYQALYSAFDREWFTLQLKRQGLDDKLSRLPSTLSFGERIKFEVLLTLATRPSVLILDEPTVGLDPVSIGTVRKLISDYVETTGALGLLTSHNLTDIEAVCRNGSFLVHGKLVEHFVAADMKSGALERRYLEVFGND